MAVTSMFAATAAATANFTFVPRWLVMNGLFGRKILHTKRKKKKRSSETFGSAENGATFTLMVAVCGLLVILTVILLCIRACKHNTL